MWNEVRKKIQNAKFSLDFELKNHTEIRIQHKAGNFTE